MTGKASMLQRRMAWYSDDVDAVSRLRGHKKEQKCRSHVDHGLHFYGRPAAVVAEGLAACDAI